jgi:signal transduction histidine kinase
MPPRRLFNALWSRLSARLLVLTALFVMLAEVLIYVPSIAQFRRNWLEDRIDAAQIAALALEATSDRMVSAGLARELLRSAGVEAVVLKRSESRLLILGDDMPIDIAARYDLRRAMPWTLIRDAFATLLVLDEHRLIEVTGTARKQAGEYVQIMLYPADLKAAMIAYSGNILLLSLVISFLTAGLVYVTLSRLMVAPVRRITDSVIAFRAAPEAAASTLSPSRRSDEIGIVERELAEMQNELRAALAQKTRLANLGAAVSKINHDLRNILASAQLLSDRLGAMEDPAVRSLAPRLMNTIDRAIKLCNATLEYGRAPDVTLHLQPLMLRGVVAEAAAAIGLGADDGVIRLHNEVPDDLRVRGDSEQLFRVFLNLLRNAKSAMESMPDGGPRQVTVRAARDGDGVTVDVVDQGPGLSGKAREHLFEPFRGSASVGGTGLGLAIAADIMAAHGGDICLLDSGPGGATFRLRLPDKVLPAPTTA